MARPSNTNAVNGLEEQWRKVLKERDANRDSLPDTQRNLRVQDVISALETAFNATGDPVFEEARLAFEAYGFPAHGILRGARHANKNIYGDSTSGYFVQMKCRIAEQNATVTHAARLVVAEFGIRGQSFDEVAKDLANAYRGWQSDGEQEPLAALDGDLGYRIYVKPTGHEVPIPGGGKFSLDGACQPATRYWRRRLMEGSVWLRRVPE